MFQRSQLVSKLRYAYRVRKRGDSCLPPPPNRFSPSNLKKPHLPRAQRLILQTPVRYRVKGLGIWRKGIVENLSQSGVFFHGPMHLPEYALVEMVFEMPEEISGQKHRTVLCHGRVLRRDEVTRLRSRRLGCGYPRLHISPSKLTEG